MRCFWVGLRSPGRVPLMADSLSTSHLASPADNLKEMEDKIQPFALLLLLDISGRKPFCRVSRPLHPSRQRDFDGYKIWSGLRLPPNTRATGQRVFTNTHSSISFLLASSSAFP